MGLDALPGANFPQRFNTQLQSLFLKQYLHNTR